MTKILTRKSVLLLLALFAAGYYFPLKRVWQGHPQAQAAARFPVFAASTSPAPDGPAAVRAGNYEDALALAKDGNKDIVVIQRGSDWNYLGETLYHGIWQTDEFARRIGGQFVLVGVDLQEVPGAAPLPAVYRDATGKIVVPAAEANRTDPAALLAKSTGESGTPPASELESVVTEGNVPFARRPDGTFVAKLTPNPAQDVLTLKLKTTRAGKLLRVDFPLDPSLPGDGPGRANNANFVISEIETQLDGKPIKACGAWASYSEGTGHACKLIDGISDKGDNGWLGGGHLHKPRTVLLAMQDAVPANADLTVRILCKTQWAQHVPGAVRAAVVDAPDQVAAVCQVSSAQALALKNAKYDWWDRTYCPRIAVLDSKGRGYGCINNPRLDLTSASLAREIHRMQGVRVNRDALWEQADKATGAARAALLRDGFATMLTQIGSTVGYGVWKGNGNCYQWIWDEVAKADPKDDSWNLRWLNTGLDSRCGVAGMEEVGKLLADKKYEEAIALVDKTLADPRAGIFDNDRRQRLMNTKFHIYRSWPGHTDDMARVQREIAALDGSTYLGLGARGDLTRHWQVPEPKSLSYGWGKNQVKAGVNKWDWDMGVALPFDHAGRYTIRIKQNGEGGKDTLKLASIRVMDGPTVLAESVPAAPGNEIAPGKTIELAWRIAPEQWQANRNLHLALDVVAEEGKVECSGMIEVEPQWEESELPGKIPARRDMVGVQRELAGKLAASGSDIPGDTALAGDLARHELIRACGADALNELQARPGGTRILDRIMGNPPWIETLLTSGPPTESFARTMDNLRILFLAGKDLDNPLYQRVATAIALSAGKTIPYRQVECLRYTQQAHQDLLLHAGFDHLTVRDLRNTVSPGMSAAEYQYVLDDRQHTLGDYFGACNAIWYRGENDFGTSIHGGGYHEPWNWCWPRNRIFRQVGGVCGTLSTYGSTTARVHGVPSFPVGQPGHCAYVVRSGLEWPVGNSVTWPTSCSAPGWEGTGYSTFHRLYEPIMQDSARVLAGNRLLWLARLQKQASAATVRILPGLQFSRYVLPGGGLPEFDKLTPAATGTCQTIDLAAALAGNNANVGVVWTGKIEVSGNGPVRISSLSDDASRILIDGQEMVRANCNVVEKIQPLAPGIHDLRVEFSQGGGNLGLTVVIEGVSGPGDWCATAEKAIAAQPGNYGVWIEYAKMLEATREVPPQTWLDLGRNASKTFAICNEAGWGLAMRCLDKVFPGMTPAQRYGVIVDCNRELRQDLWQRPEGYPIEGVFNWQADRIGDPVLAVRLFKEMLGIHYSDKPGNNWIFGQVMNWGTNRFANNKATSVDYARAMDAFFTAQGSKADKSQMSTIITANIRKASETGDMQSYQLWTIMAGRFLPALTPGEVFLNADQAKAHPVIPPFPGTLLSRSGMLQSSSACGSDRPRSYLDVLSDTGFGGFLDTNHEPKPWAQVQLAGPGEISGIILVDRFEYSNPNDKGQVAELAWLPPFKVSISADGKTWTEIATIPTPSPDRIYRIDLTGKPATTQYVRVEHIPDPNADPKTPPGRLHLRHFLVYGKKLY